MRHGSFELDDDIAKSLIYQLQNMVRDPALLFAVYAAYRIHEQKPVGRLLSTISASGRRHPGLRTSRILDFL